MGVLKPFQIKNHTLNPPKNTSAKQGEKGKRHVMEILELVTLLSNTFGHVCEFNNRENKYDTDDNHYTLEKCWCGYFSDKHSCSQNC